MHLKI